MRAVIVCGCGRTGTNVVLEILRGNPALKATEPEEDKNSFAWHRIIPEGHLTKTDTVYFESSHAMKKMSENTHLRLIWTIRDPRDTIMSKMRRGVPIAEGGDCKGYASDATPSGAISDIERAIRMLSEIHARFPKRVMVVRMEDVLRHTIAYARKFCRYLDLPYHPDMPKFWTRMRVEQKAKRYKKKDMSQIELWRHWRDYEGGWLVSKGLDMDRIFEKVLAYVRYFGYPEV